MIFKFFKLFTHDCKKAINNHFIDNEIYVSEALSYHNQKCL